MKLSTYIAEEYLPYARRYLKPSSVNVCKGYLDRLAVPALPDDLEAITRADIIKLHKRLVRTPIQANRTIAAVSAVLRLALEQGLLQVNPCQNTRLYRERKRERFLSPEEQDRIRSVLTDKPVDILIGLMLATGARPGELVGAKWEWLNPDRTTLRLPDSKRGARTIFITETARRLLDKLPLPHKGQIFTHAIDRQRGWKRVLTAAGVADARPYDLRHTFASNALRAGHNLSAIGLTLGHSSAQTTMRYAHLSTEQGLAVAAAANGEGK